MCSNMNAIFVVSATIYCLGIIISSHYCLGSPNLIEYVEEWGCYDTEIRLTCGHLDSKIAILEATFTPNCTQEECIKGDLKRLMRGRHRSTFANFHSAETEAGQKFLETLRETDLDPNAELVNDDSLTAESIPKANYLVGVKEKRASLRASLERLIVKYLRQISPGDNLQGFGERLKRYRRNLLSLTNSESESGETVTESRSERVMIGTRNVSIDDIEMQDRAGSSEERYRKYYENRGFCDEQKRKLGTLSRLHMDESLKKQNDTRQNIRKNLNKRCSGKNHCSFLFAADDPVAVLWDSGLVHIKYVCMNDYHTNHYCNEHLTIGYDNSPKRRQVQEPGKGEPVAQARVQTRDQVLHSVKILKTNDEVENIPIVEEEELPKRRKSEKIQNARKKDKGIYSQDFKVLKILPSNLDDFNDIEEIGDEIYFRTDDDKKKDMFPNDLEPTALTLGSDSPPPPPPAKASIMPIITVTTSGYSKNLETSENRNSDLSKFDNITIIIREGEQYFVTYPKPRILDSSYANEPSAESTNPPPPAAPTTTATATILSFSSISTPSSSILPPFPSTMPPASIMASTMSASNRPLSTIDEIATATAGASFVTFSESVTDDSPRYSVTARPKQQEEIETTNEQDIETAAPTVTVLSVDASRRQYTTVNNEWGDSSYDDMGSKPDRSTIDEDDDVDESLESGYYGGTVRRQYTSIQRTYYGAPKPQGFTMTPGYPKFYIGDCECKWKILAPVAQKIRLTILDISLRYEKKCRDYLQITDSVSKKILFKSCEEPVAPVEILSSSNQVEIVVKAATKFAYPKRGVLIHYSALGCLTPPPPMHGHFVERTDSTVTFACELSFVFADSSQSTRQLLCTDQHSWNDTLPDCVEEDAVSDSGIVSGLNSDFHKTVTVTGAKMGHAEADTVLDIIVPTILIVGLFAVNAIIFVIIMKQRKRSTSQMDAEAKELAEL